MNGWRDGTSNREIATLNPFNDDVPAQFQGASKQDVDDAYAAAQHS